jgi:hypothetical protein
MDFHETTLAFLRSTRQIPSVDENDFYADRMELDVNVDVVDLLDKSRTSFNTIINVVLMVLCLNWTFFMLFFSDFRRIFVVRTWFRQKPFRRSYSRSTGPTKCPDKGNIVLQLTPKCNKQPKISDVIP